MPCFLKPDLFCHSCWFVCKVVLNQDLISAISECLLPAPKVSHKEQFLHWTLVYVLLRLLATGVTTAFPVWAPPPAHGWWAPGKQTGLGEQLRIPTSTGATTWQSQHTSKQSCFCPRISGISSHKYIYLDSSK